MTTNYETAKQQFILDNTKEWTQRGQRLKERREKLQISLTSLSKMLGTSTSRIRKFENGEPVTLSKSLESSYQMALEMHELKQPKNMIDHIHIQHHGGGYYTLDLALLDNNSIYLEETKTLKGAIQLAFIKGSMRLDVPVILESANESKLNVGKIRYSYLKTHLKKWQEFMDENKFYKN
ncbi:helix-turn-helix domain-containing protein [Niallia sp. 01092]|uniref:helix-turn-helix domain-containing protein n=1 Tax=Niallia sp. 01092 TaxID=3457759 RepID=UPI003FD152AD